MKTFKKVHLISAIVAMSALTFVACGDDDSASTYNIIESSDTNSDDIDDQGMMLNPVLLKRLLSALLPRRNPPVLL